jgi:Zn-dependent peptidase ImmA (M78 family)
MTFRVPFVAEESIERDATTLLAKFARARHVEIRAPIPIEDIVEKYLKLRVEFDDLHRLLGVPRGAEAEMFGAIWLETGEIVIDESLDPEDHPLVEGRYRFTLAHEGGGHWRLHRPLVRANGAAGSFSGRGRQPNIICRPSQSKERVEWQADFYASCLLMPRKLIMQAWQDHFGNLRPFVSDWERSCWLSPGLLVGGKPVTERNAHLLADSDFREIAKEFAHRFQVSVQAMRIRLEKLGLLLQAEPRQHSADNCVQASFF